MRFQQLFLVIALISCNSPTIDKRSSDAPTDSPAESPLLVANESQEPSASALASTSLDGPTESSGLPRNTFFLDQNGNALTAAPSSSGSVVWSQNKITLTAPAKVTMRIGLSVSRDFMPVFSAFLHLKTPGAPAYSVKYFVAGKDKNNELIYRREVGNKMLERGTRRLLNINVGPALEGEVIKVLTIEFTPTNTVAGMEPVIDIIDPHLRKKINILSHRETVNYIDYYTLMKLDPIQLGQLKELYNAGHRVWVIGFRTLAQAEAATKVIKANALLSSMKWLVGGPALHKEEVCDHVFFRDAGADTFKNPPIFTKRASGKDSGTVSESDLASLTPAPSILRRNCVAWFDRADPRRASLLGLLTDWVEMADMFEANKLYFAGFYLFDEAASAGIEASHQENLYAYLSAKKPSHPVVLTHSFYLGGHLLAPKFTDSYNALFYSPDAADIFFFDHYSIPAIRYRDNLGRQFQFIDFLARLKMFNKPFIKLFGTGTTAMTGKEVGNPCNASKEEFKDIFRLTHSIRNQIPAEERRNWSSLGFWGFFDRESRPNHTSDWVATMAFQQTDNCPAMFDAVLDYSKGN